MKLLGQVALVTGGARRIGASVALALAAEGADVVINYRNSQSDAEAVAAKIRELGRRALVLQADVSKRAEVIKMFRSVMVEFNRLDILVNNAGAFSSAKFEELSEEQWDEMLATNLKSQYMCAQSAIPMLKQNGRGRIINMSSLGGLLPWPAYVHYCVSKAGVVMLTRCLARALAPEITVNSVAPGTIQFPGELLDEAFVRRAPLGRVGTGDDIADAVLYFVHSEFVTGEVLAVDGGRSLA